MCKHMSSCITHVYAHVAGLTYIGFNAARIDCDTLFQVALFIHWALTDEEVCANLLSENDQRFIQVSAGFGDRREAGLCSNVQGALEKHLCPSRGSQVQGRQCWDHAGSQNRIWSRMRHGILPRCKELACRPQSRCCFVLNVCSSYVVSALVAASMC